jgi:hypothetical protein
MLIRTDTDTLPGRERIDRGIDLEQRTKALSADNPRSGRFPVASIKPLE